ncbi:MAG: SlyX family protein [Gammaproteobacteria bacterium]|nr:SlyX family protein [Gammaproteobacteria bacterium]
MALLTKHNEADHPTPTEITLLTEQLHNLQMTQSYQESTIESLEKTVVQQHADIQQLQDQVRLLSEYLKTLKQDFIKNPGDESPPPHY